MAVAYLGRPARCGISQPFPMGWQTFPVLPRVGYVPLCCSGRSRIVKEGGGRLPTPDDQRVAGKRRKQCVPDFGLGHLYLSPLPPREGSETKIIGAFVIVQGPRYSSQTSSLRLWQNTIHLRNITKWLVGYEAHGDLAEHCLSAVRRGSQGLSSKKESRFRAGLVCHFGPRLDASTLLNRSYVLCTPQSLHFQHLGWDWA